MTTIKRFALPLFFMLSIFMLSAATSAPAVKPVAKPAIAASAPAPAPVAVVPAAPAAAPASAPAAVPAVSPTGAHVDLEQPTVTEVIKNAEEAIKLTKEYAAGQKAGKDDTESGVKKALALFGIISIILKLLLSLLKTVAPFFNTNPKASLILRLGTIVVGVLVFIFSDLALGMPWWEALIAGMSGPGAVLWHEYSKMLPWFGKKEEKK